jgi:polysaccharide biosynthesis transport protein
MDFGYLLQLLNRRKWLILGAMLLSGVLVYVLIGRRPERYKATVLISTGIVNYKGINSNGDDAFVQQFQIENAFANLIEFAQSRSSLKILSLHMLKHDLQAESDKSKDWPFRKPNVKLYGEGVLNEAQQLLASIQALHLDSISNPSFSQDMDYLIDRVSRTYGYDHDAILRSLAVKRKGSTDYLVVEVTTENPKLSQYMANSYVDLFMQFYQNLQVREKRNNVTFYQQLSKEKKAVVDTIKSRRYAYLYRQGLPVLGKQSEELVGQISELELQKQKAEANRLSATEAIGQLQQYIDGRGNMEATETRNRVVDKYNVADLNTRVRELTEKSSRAGGKDAKIEAELAGARHSLDQALKSSSGNLGRRTKQDEAVRTQEDLYKDKVAADLQRIEAEKSISIIDGEIGKRTSRLSAYVANDEVATGLADEQLRAEDEFKTVNEELIAAKLALANTECPLQVIENAQLPEWPEPNRQTLISLFAAIVIGTMLVIGLFVLAYMDRSMQSPEVFARQTRQLPLLGFTPHISLKGLDFEQVFSSNGEMPQYGLFRENLRKMRNKMAQMEAKVFLFTSTRPEQGKTLTAYSLAHALAANHKRVLMLDTNFKTPLPADLSVPAQGETAKIIEKMIARHGFEGIFRLGSASATGKGAVLAIVHHGTHQSPAEMLPAAQFEGFLAELGTIFDFIFMEAAALNRYSDAQELLPFADQVVAIFNAGSTLNSADQASLQYLRGLGDKFAGAILADVDVKNISV